MGVFDSMAGPGHEQLLFCRDDTVGLRAIISIHSTALGPAIGGLRIYDYPDEGDALRDVLRLSRGMTYKAAMAGLDFGGGQAVILGDPSVKDEALLRAFGRHVESLGGRYITAEDMNTTVEDMSWIRRETRWVTGYSPRLGGSGHPARATAWGTYQGIRACLEVVHGSPEVAGRTVAIQGVGAVGHELARLLHESGAHLVVCDISERKVRRVLDELGGEAIDEDDFYGADVDVLAPCAIGGVINRATIPLIKAPIIAGAANNQLDDPEGDARLLAEAGITYAPDYVINAGGLIQVCGEIVGYPVEQALADAGRIFDTVKRVINRARSRGLTTAAAADEMAEERIARITGLRRLGLPGRW